MNEEQLNQFIASISSDNLEAVKAQIAASPELAASIAKKMAEKRKGETGNAVIAGLDILKNIGFTAASLGQIAKSNTGLKAQVQPSLPAVRGLSPQLTEALYAAGRGTQDVNSILNPAKQEAQNAYRSALQQAQVTSGGQSGAYQGNANAANIERMKAAVALAPIAQQAKLQNTGVYNNLLGMRQQENQNQFNNQYFNTQLAMDQYNRNQQMYGNLGLVGRENLYNTLGNLSGSLQRAVPAYLPFADSYKNFMKKTALEHGGFTGREQFDPQFEPGIEQPLTGQYQPPPVNSPYSTPEVTPFSGYQPWNKV